MTTPLSPTSPTSPEPSIPVTISGTTVPVPASIASDDAQLRAALAPHFAEAATAEITRVKDEAGTTTTVSLVKRAGPKGLALLAGPGAPDAPDAPRALPGMGRPHPADVAQCAQIVQAIAWAAEEVPLPLLLAWQLRTLEDHGTLTFADIEGMQEEIETAYELGAQLAGLAHEQAQRIEAALALPVLGGIPLGF